MKESTATLKYSGAKSQRSNLINCRLNLTLNLPLESYPFKHSAVV